MNDLKRIINDAHAQATPEERGHATAYQRLTPPPNTTGAIHPNFPLLAGLLLSKPEDELQDLCKFYDIPTCACHPALDQLVKFCGITLNRDVTIGDIEWYGLKYEEFDDLRIKPGKLYRFIGSSIVCVPEGVDTKYIRKWDDPVYMAAEEEYERQMGVRE